MKAAGRSRGAAGGRIRGHRIAADAVRGNRARVGSEPDVATAAGLVVERPGLEPGTLGLGGHRNQCGSVPYRPVASPIGRLNRPFGSLAGYSWTVPDGLGSQMLGGCWVDKPG